MCDLSQALNAEDQEKVSSRIQNKQLATVTFGARGFQRAQNGNGPTFPPGHPIKSLIA
jgi:hypothetical protein